MARLVHVQHDCHGGKRPVERRSFPDLEILRTTGRFLRGQPDRRQDLPAGKRILAVHVGLGQHEKIRQWNPASLAGGIRQLHFGTVRGKRGGQCGGMDDGASLVGENGVVAVVTLKGKAVRAALAQTVMCGGAEIPAAGSLQQVPAEGGAVADLRAGGERSRLAQCGMAAPHGGMRGDLGERGERADAHAPVLFPGDAVQFRQAADIDQSSGVHQPLFHEIQQVHPAGLDERGLRGVRPAGQREHRFGGGMGGDGDRFRGGSGALPGEGFHQ